jgi:hypothetical protein
MSKPSSENWRGGFFVLMVLSSLDFFGLWRSDRRHDKPTRLHQMVKLLDYASKEIRDKPRERKNLGSPRRIAGHQTRCDTASDWIERDGRRKLKPRLDQCHSGQPGV